MTRRLASRGYRTALFLLPPEVRAQHGEAMAAVFDQLADDARRRAGRVGAGSALAAELVTLLRFALTAWRGRAPRPRLEAYAVAAIPDRERNTSMLAALVQDTRYALRLLRRSPGFAVVCLTTIALAVGANTAIFGVVHGVILKALPFEDPDRVVVIGHVTRAGGTNGVGALDSTTPGNLYDWMRGATGFAAMGGFAPTERIVTVEGGAERLQGGLCVGAVFEVLGRQAADGRALRLADDDPGAAAVVVLSARLARRLFGAGRAVGQSLTIEGRPHAIVGVMPADFAFFDYDYEYWVPARFDAAFRDNRDQYFLAGIGRLRPGVSIAQADAQINTVMDAIRRDWPQFTQNVVAAVRPVKPVLLDGVERRLEVLMGAAVFVLLIACANLGNLMLARATTRQREMAVRHALGAGHGRLMRQMLAESLLLALLGGVLGLGVGAALLGILVAHLPTDLPRLSGVALDWPVLGFAVGISLAAGGLFGVVPALQVAGTAPMRALRAGTRASDRGVVRGGLVVTEVALALMLLAGAGLLGRSFAALLQVPPGFAAERLLTFTASLPTTDYTTPADRSGFFERAAAEIGSLPGVTTVTFSTMLPVAGRGSGAWFNMLDRPVPSDQTPPAVPNRFVRANYFEAIGIPVVRGRGFTAQDGERGANVVVISASVAQRFYADRDPIGQRIYMGAPDNRVVPESEIIGVVADVKQRGLDEARPEAIYVPHAMQRRMPSFTFAVRTTTDPAALAPAVRDVLRRLDPGVPILRLQTMDDILARSTAPARSSTLLVGLFAAVALALALIGVFGVLSYTVSQRTTEFGIRMALGASASAVRRHVLAGGMRPVLGGVLVGLAGALALARVMESLLFGVPASDPLTLASVVALLLLTAAIAAYVPARRATRVDPVEALRQQ